MNKIRQGQVYKILLCRSATGYDLRFSTTRKQSLGQGNIFAPVCHSVHRVGISACIAGGIPACLAAGLQGGYPSIPCKCPGPHPGGEFRGIWPAGVFRPTPKGEVEGDLAEGGGLQAQTRGLPGSEGGSAPRGSASPGRLLLRAVHILLECMLVYVEFLRCGCFGAVLTITVKDPVPSQSG